MVLSKNKDSYTASYQSTELDQSTTNYDTLIEALPTCFDEEAERLIVLE